MNHAIETFTGVRPTANLTVANYIGAVKPVIAEEQAGATSSVFLAELHAATTTPPREVAEHSRELVRTFIASGVQGEIYGQRDVQDLVAQTELAIRGLTSVSRLLRLPTLKEKVRDSDDVSTANVALAMYPMMMAADIILARPQYVPTGKDQKPHLEITNELIRSFNREYDASLPEPIPRDVSPVNILSLDHSGRKMSKTLPSGAVYLDDDAAVARKKIMKAPTAGQAGPEMDIAVDNLVAIADGLSGDAERLGVVAEYANRAKAGEPVVGKLKGEVGDITADFLKDLSDRRASVSDADVKERLQRGHDYFRPIGAATLAHMQSRMWGDV